MTADVTFTALYKVRCPLVSLASPFTLCKLDIYKIIPYAR